MLNFTTMLSIWTGRYGTLCIRENLGCLFIATNRDAVGHMTDLQEWPGYTNHDALFLSNPLFCIHAYNLNISLISGAGCMVAAICGSTQKEPIVVGKPSPFMMDFLLKKYVSVIFALICVETCEPSHRE